MERITEKTTEFKRIQFLGSPFRGEKRLMFMISTHGKSSEQISKEGWDAFQKYKKTEEKVSPKMD